MVARALAARGHVRATQDLEWVRASPDNAPRVIAALSRFGAPLGDLVESDLSRPGVVFQVGVAPVRIDVLTSIDGVEFEAAWNARGSATLGTLSVPVISKKHLIENKRASGHLQVLADVERLESDSAD